MSRLVDC